MPNFDGTGPAGAGPMTGRGLGLCGGCLGWRCKFGLGRGIGRYLNWGRLSSKSDQKKVLADYKKAIEEELEKIKQQEIELNK